MADVFDSYEAALERLLQRLGRDQARNVEARTLQGRLLENIAGARRYGDSENLRSERARIREALDLLSLDTLGASFTELVFSAKHVERSEDSPAAMAGRVFLAYSHQDQDFAHRLAANLRDAGVPVWVDRWHIPPGADWDQAIDDAVYACGRFLIVLSPAAMDSLELRGELRIALDEGKQIVPVLYQHCRMPRRLRLLQYVDFRSVGPEDPDALGRLLQALAGPDSSTAVEVEGRSEAAQQAVQTAVQGKEGPVEGGPSSRAAPVKTALPAVIRPALAFEPEMVLVPAGEFVMGSDPLKDHHAGGDEQPQHTLYLPDFYLARTPLTNAQYAAFVEATGSWVPSHWGQGKPPEGEQDYPVVNISWASAMEYCRWLSSVTGQSYSLPSEAEWEKGARGVDGRICPWGDEWDSQCCGTRGLAPAPTPVGLFPRGASPYGLLDMVGNVWQWTRSLYRPYPYDPADGREDLKAAGERVMRGGPCQAEKSAGGLKYVRCARRGRSQPGQSHYNRGFRVALVLPGHGAGPSHAPAE